MSTHPAPQDSGQNSDVVAKLMAQIESQEAAHERLLHRLRSVEQERNQWQSRAQTLAEQEADLKALAHELQNAQGVVERDRQTMRERVQREIEVERTALIQLQSTLQVEQEELFQKVKEKEHEYELALQNIHAKLDEERDGLKEKLRDEIRREVVSEHQELDEQRDEFETQRLERLEELQRQAAEVEEQREEFDRQLSLEREQLEKSLERQRHDLQNEKSLFQKRYRFQFDHLQQQREELEVSLRSFRREEGQLRIDARRFDDINQLRQRQLMRLLNVIRQRESSVSRQAEILAATFATNRRETEQAKNQLTTDRHQWEKQLAERQQELDRRDDVLRVRTDEMNRQRKQLQDLRLEIEKTHKTTLETRLAIEAAQAKLADVTDQPAAKQALKEARHDVEAQTSKVTALLASREEELLKNIARLERQQSQQTEKQQAMDAAASLRERQLEAEIAVLKENERHAEDVNSQWQSVRDKWQRERLEAEQVIRDLLEQLTQKELADLESNRTLLENPAVVAEESGQAAIHETSADDEPSRKAA